MVMPGDNTAMTVHLNKPIAMEEALKFAIREGGRTVGAGVVTRIREMRPRNTSAALEPRDSGQARGPEVTVWYGTNRRPVEQGPSAGFLDGQDDEVLHLGSCVVHVPTSHKFGSIGTPWWKRWWQLRISDGMLVLDGINPAGSVDEFAADLLRAVGTERSQKRALVYLHGYNTTFAEAAIRAAQLATDINPPGVTTFFSWPSYGDFDAYPGDSQRAAASEAFFIEFLRILVEEAGMERIDLLVHSMGNQVFARSVQQLVLGALKQSIPFGVIILAAPDIDTNLFRQIAPSYLRIAEKATMYVSSKDVALHLSKFIQRGSRAGFSPPITVVAGIDTVEVSSIDFSKLVVCRC